MDLRHLRHFVAVAEELHFGRAAQRLGIAQPPLSQSIQGLEAELGVTLLERTRRSVALTGPGTLLLTEARAILDRADRAVVLTRRAAAGEVGELRIGFTAAAPIDPVVPVIIDGYRRALPDVHLTLNELSSKRQAVALREGTIDVGFVRAARVPREEDDEDLAFITLERDPLNVVLRADHPLAGRARVALADLAGESFVFYPSEAGTTIHDQVMGLCAEVGFRPQVVLEAAEALTIIGLIAAGLGVSILPGHLHRMAMEGLVFRPLDVPPGEIGAEMILMLACRRGRREAHVERFVAIARAASRA
ncbi:DNA-binding transcriptional LysR family regulator [Azospirillum fermentarium]|uniref:LysR substrate-binding domain-containing protein n=1 Tax=Azospirillum fermentarium TaxID=1233114 RepID=UPI0022266F0A|nr:LysR substrate-binding domain-containing protein [Azospirillum fermentarium]MCW2246290.1 DNA-binding transcriptional LysR family regulator [Azospirillum fermentarium]